MVGDALADAGPPARRYSNPDMDNQLRTIRQMRGLSVDQLARQVGASRSKLYKLENGSQHLTDVWIARLAKALGVAPADFLNASGPSIPVSY
ncbi:MAG: helix-turn-helix transcriptional regulator [Alphaproteobacteria bacterium]|nr:helix-turn-helix transcriptional regulator [Alphaproteobacteria bacterium]MBL6953789.1 helix-turn-helix transcriptional regulator [Alphaproteobacteria bacterium]